MQPEPPPAHIMMVVIDPAHPRADQEGRLLAVPEEDADGRAITFVLLFSGGERETFGPAQVRLVQEARR